MCPAYSPVKDKVPCHQVIDHLHIERNNIGRECLYKVVEELSKLRYEMQTNMPIIDLVDRGG